jgi:hypothetical protein
MSADLVPVKNAQLASVLGLLEEISPESPAPEQPYIVRVFAAPVIVGECQGAVSSCPDVRIFVTVSTGDLGDAPVLYELPVAKGWEFMGRDKPATAAGRTMSGFTVQTALPDSNVDAPARNAWHPKVYHVLISPTAASYTRQ